MIHSVERPGWPFRIRALSMRPTATLAIALALASAVGARAQEIELVFTYGSEKESWINAVTDTYNAAPAHTLPDGRKIRVYAYPMGSGEAMDEILTGRFSMGPKNPKDFKAWKDGKKPLTSPDLRVLRPQLVSPASGAFIELYNSRSKRGPLVLSEPRNLVLSPVVIAMWRPMAEALGWPASPISWRKILDLARDPRGWAAHGQPQFGAFKFAHTHPMFSNSGLIALLAEVVAAQEDAAAPLDLEKLNRPATGKFLADIEQSVVHYGESTGFFAQKMFANGPSYLSAAILYENLVIESYDRKRYPKLEQDPFDRDKFRVVAIYPAEGTFWSDHPVAVVAGVSDEQRKAAEDYIAYLLSEEPQRKALAYGFRPGDEAIALSAPIDASHGVSASEPKRVLKMPPGEVIERSLQLWEENKKHVQLVLVIDRSGSMRMSGRMVRAQEAAARAIGMLGDNDYLSILTFNDQCSWALKETSLSKGRAAALKAIDQIFPDGQTALFDSIQEAYGHLQANRRKGCISAIVVLTDGANNFLKGVQVTKAEVNEKALTELLDDIRLTGEREATRVFTVHYEAGAMRSVMERIAQAAQAKAFEGKIENIAKVMKDIFIYFGGTPQ